MSGEETNRSSKEKLIGEKKKSLDKFVKRNNKNDIIVISPSRDTRIDANMKKTDKGYFVAKNEKISVFEKNKKIQSP